MQMAGLGEYSVIPALTFGICAPFVEIHSPVRDNPLGEVCLYKAGPTCCTPLHKKVAV